MAEQDPDPKNALLSELESIKGLLNEQHTEDSMPDLNQIPVLREVFESIEPVPEDRPHQSPLFHEVGTQPQRSTRPVQAKGENPFLPAHIRARLQGNRPTQLWPQATEQTETTTAEPTEEPAGANNEQASSSRPATKRLELIEALITEFQPQIEAQLKARLEAMTDEQLEALSS